MSNIHKNLKQLRLSKNLTQENVAEKIGVTRQAISSYESGRTQPSVDLLMRFAEIYDTDLEEILYGKRTENHEFKRIKVIFAIVVFLWLLFRIMQVGMFMLADEAFLPAGEGTIAVETQEMKDAIDLRFKYLDRAYVFESFSCAILGVGSLILLILDLVMKKPVSMRKKWIVFGIMTVISFGIGKAGGFLTPINEANLMWPFYYSFINMMLLLLINLAAHRIKGWIQWKRAV